MAANVADTADSDTSFTYVPQTNGTTWRGTLRYRFRSTAAGSYQLHMTTDSNTATLYRVVGSTFTNIGTVALPTSNMAKRVRVRAEGTTLNVKAWDPTGTEPSGWTTSVTDTVITTAGTTQFDAYSNTGTAKTGGALGRTMVAGCGGASTFPRESDLVTSGKVWMLPAGSVVPPGLAVVPDGADYGGPAPSSHHSVVANRRMTFAEFDAKYRGLSWVNTGRVHR